MSDLVGNPEDGVSQNEAHKGFKIVHVFSHAVTGFLIIATHMSLTERKIIRILLKLALGGITSVAHFITGQEQPQLNRVCFFRFIVVFITSKGFNYSDK